MGYSQSNENAQAQLQRDADCPGSTALVAVARAEHLPAAAPARAAHADSAQPVCKRLTLRLPDTLRLHAAARSDPFYGRAEEMDRFPRYRV
jgi:hypothetical protein